jgi:hypothetical protein
MSDLNDINNNNFPNGFPNGNVNRRVRPDLSRFRIDDNILFRNAGERNLNFNNPYADDFGAAPPRRAGRMQPRVYDLNIEKESPWDDILTTNLNKIPTKKLAAYPEYNDVNFNQNNRNAINRYGNAYQTGTLTDNDYDLSRFDDILKRKGTKSRYGPDKPVT